MSRHLHLEPIGGIAGDMMLAALIDLLGDPTPVTELPGRLNLDGVSVTVGRTTKHQITARTVQISTSGESPHRHLKHIRAIITAADLPERAAKRALFAFERLADAEAKIHDSDPERIHFHEVGADDAIVDIVGTCLLFDILSVDSATCAPLPVRRGITTAAHGAVPLPAPATLELLKGWPLDWHEGEGELVTPTGAALAAALTRPGMPPEGSLGGIGYGAGSMDLADRPNILRAGLYETSAAAVTAATEPICELVASVDDATGEQLARAAEILLGAGALDAYYKALVMKKGRPGWELTVLCHPADSQQLASLVLAHTGTGGVRRRTIERFVAAREIVTVETTFGTVHAKVFTDADGGQHPAPEYEECKALAAAAHVPLARVQQEVIRIYWNLKGDR